MATENNKKGKNSNRKKVNSTKKNVASNKNNHAKKNVARKKNVNKSSNIENILKEDINIFDNIDKKQDEEVFKQGESEEEEQVVESDNIDKKQDEEVFASQIKEQSKKVQENKKNKSNAKFNLLEVVIIMVITAVCSITLTIKVSYVINKTSKKIMAEAELLEFNETYQSITNEYYEKIDKKELINAAISGMVDYLDDPYSKYLDKDKTEVLNEELEGEYVGMGGEITFRRNGEIYISKVYENSPAQKAGLKANDTLIKVGDKAVKGMTLTEVSALVKGKSGTKVKVTIRRDKEEKEFEITRGKIDIQSVTTKIYEKNDKKIGYINISTFANNTYAQFEKAEKELENKKVDSLILDLRGNTGGYLTSVTSIAEMFVKKGDIIYQLDTKGKIDKIKSKKDPSIKLKVAVLVNKSTASASEILTAALKENINAEVIGVTTYGKGKVQKTRTLSTGAMIKYTTQNWLTTKGEEIDGKGIAPTVELELDPKYYTNRKEANDNQLQKAIEMMSK